MENQMLLWVEDKPCRCRGVTFTARCGMTADLGTRNKFVILALPLMHFVTVTSPFCASVFLSNVKHPSTCL